MNKISTSKKIEELVATLDQGQKRKLLKISEAISNYLNYCDTTYLEEEDHEELVISIIEALKDDSSNDS
jgi:hypothetical protein